MDIRGVLAGQINKSNAENQNKKREAEILMEEKLKKKEVEEKTQKILQKIKFEKEKKKLEDLDFREIMTTLAQELNHPDGTYSILKDRIIDLIQGSPSYSQINDSPKFSVSRNYDFEDHCNYLISFHYSDLYGHSRVLFSVSYVEHPESFHISMNLPKHLKKNSFTSDDPSTVAEEIVTFLLTD